MIFSKKEMTWVRNVLFVVLVTTANACEWRRSFPESYEYKYVGIETGRVISFDTSKKNVDNGHRVFGFEFCDKPSFRVCIYGEITLAIPKGELKRGDTWQIAGSKFSVASVSSSKEEVNYVIAANFDNAGEKMDIFQSN